MKRLFALLLSLLLLCGCARQSVPEEIPVQSAQTAAPAAVNAVNLAVEWDAGFDPYNCHSASNRLVLELVLQPLFTVQPNGEVLPELAKGWAVSVDGMTTTVYLRSDITFHNGQPMTAAEVAASVERAKAGSYYGGRFRYVTEVLAPSEYTLVLKTEKAYECLPRLLDIPVVAGSHAKPVGTGPYTWDGDAGLKQAAQWTQVYPSRAQTIGFVPVTDAITLRDGFQYGGISAALLDPNEPSALAYNGDHELWSVPTAVMEYVGFNLESGPFADGGLRSAVTYVVDRTSIVREDMGGAGTEAVLAALPGSAGDVAELSARVSFDPAKFRALGITVAEGESCTMIVSTPGSQRARSAQRIADQLTRCGIPVQVEALSAEKYRAALQNGAFDLYYAEVRLTPDLDLAPLFSTLGYGGLDSYEQMLQLCDLARANGGNAYDLQKAILVDGLFCPVAFKQMELYIHRDVLNGVSPKLGGWILS